MILFSNIFLIIINIFICIDDSSTTSISKVDDIYKMREIDECQEDRSQKVNITF